MLPWGHAALGYLLYTSWCRMRYQLPPQGVAVLALGVGTQFPDLIDKPLSWTFEILPTGRSLAHSLFVLALVLSLAVWATRRYRSSHEPAAWAFGLGYVSHLLGDSFGPILEGNIGSASYLLWPVIPAGEPEHSYSFVAFFLSLTVTPLLAFGLIVTVVGIAVWIYDGMPGLATLGLRPPRQRDAVRDR